VHRQEVYDASVGNDLSDGAKPATQAVPPRIVDSRRCRALLASMRLPCQVFAALDFAAL